MKIKYTSLLPRPVTAALLTGLLCCLPAGNQRAQMISFGGLGSTSLSTTFQGHAAAVSGVAAGSFVSVADTGFLPTSGGAQEAAALETTISSGLSVGASHSTLIGGADTSAS